MSCRVLLSAEDSPFLYLMNPSSSSSSSSSSPFGLSAASQESPSGEVTKLLSLRKVFDPGRSARGIVVFGKPSPRSSPSVQELCHSSSVQEPSFTSSTSRVAAAYDFGDGEVLEDWDVCVLSFSKDFTEKPETQQFEHLRISLSFDDSIPKDNYRLMKLRLSLTTMMLLDVVLI